LIRFVDRFFISQGIVAMGVTGVIRDGTPDIRDGGLGFVRRVSYVVGAWGVACIAR